MFTRKGGAIEQGFLMARNFDLRQELEVRPVLLATAEQAIRFVAEGNGGARLVQSKDGVSGIQARQLAVPGQEGGWQALLSQPGGPRSDGRLHVRARSGQPRNHFPNEVFLPPTFGTSSRYRSSNERRRVDLTDMPHPKSLTLLKNNK